MQIIHSRKYFNSVVKWNCSRGSFTASNCLFALSHQFEPAGDGKYQISSSFSFRIHRVIFYVSKSSTSCEQIDEIWIAHGMSKGPRRVKSLSFHSHMVSFFSHVIQCPSTTWDVKSKHDIVEHQWDNYYGIGCLIWENRLSLGASKLEVASWT